MEILFITQGRVSDARLPAGRLEQLRPPLPRACFTIGVGPAAGDIVARMGLRARAVMATRAPSPRRAAR